MVTSLFPRLRFYIAWFNSRLLYTDCLAGGCLLNQMSQYTFHYYWHDIKDILWSLLCWRRSRYVRLSHWHDHYLRYPKTTYILRKPIITGSQMLFYDWSTLSHDTHTMSKSFPCCPKVFFGYLGNVVPEKFWPCRETFRKHKQYFW